MKRAIFLAGLSLALAIYMLEPRVIVERPEASRYQVGKQQNSQKDVQSEAPIQALADSAFQKNRDAFASEAAIRQASHSIDEISSYIHAEDQHFAFSQSGLDTLENYHLALTFFDQSYAETPSQAFVQTRVLAIKFLSLSEHLGFQDCKETMDKIITALSQNKGEGYCKALSIDLYEIAQACVKLDPEQVRSYAEAQDKPRAKKAIYLALERIAA